MREILFRGKAFEGGKWYYGYVGKTSEGGTFISAGHSIIHIIPETLGQYTGLKDKNGKKIFDGDIISTDLSRPYNIVLYKNGSFMLQCEDNGRIFYDIFFSCEEEQQKTYPYCEVIGNIHDDPELMEEGE